MSENVATEAVVQLYEQGKSQREIAELFGVGRMLVRWRLLKAGVACRPRGQRRKVGGPLAQMPFGYLVTRDRQDRQVHIHRACWEAYHGTIPQGHDIHHGNGDPADNRIENLECLPHGEHTRLHRRRDKDD